MSGYWIALIAGGIALFIPGPWLVSYAFRFDFTTSFLIFTALVNIHHFLLDGAIWKLRDSRVASMLIGASATPGASAKPENEASAKTKREKRSAPAAEPSFARRLLRSTAFRLAVVALLFLWGGADQLRFALGTDESNLSALSRAARLNPYDSAVEARLGSLQSATGNSAAAIDSLSRAVAINPYSQASQETLARAMIQSGHYADAYLLYGKMLTIFPNDADALLNYGLLAEQLGHPDQSIDAWQKSLKADPTEISAHLYLAGLYDQRHDSSAAAQHWFAYLQLASARGLAPSGGVGSAPSARISPDDEISTAF
jgi:tetratricopeptide (TPR) repeat protein